ETPKEVNIRPASQGRAPPPQLALEILATHVQPNAAAVAALMIDISDLEILATHVQPNAAAVAALMIDISDRLGAATGNSSIDGYQSENPERVDAIARAVFDAVKARDIRYAEPPASWGDVGPALLEQAEVLEGRLGTCLDTTMVLAALLEQCGINSTIWLLREHA
ncbi:transglutaminase-like domain-containing protein, partial [Mycolicibacterium sphagni]|uniref:transglutaminase-like domain-containing protein n=1 Tax=Mycolicibacterium sphagni TaxID=1786 RepID=UPI0021F361C4